MTTPTEQALTNAYLRGFREAVASGKPPLHVNPHTMYSKGYMAGMAALEQATADAVLLAQAELVRFK